MLILHKDTIFNLVELLSKKSYEINKGKKNFEVRVIEPMEYKEEPYSITYMFIWAGMKNIDKQ